MDTPDPTPPEEPIDAPTMPPISASGLTFGAAPDTVASKESAREAAVGAVLGGRYRLTRHIADGGMASVWEATDEVLSRDVAIKILHSHLAKHPAVAARFQSEAIAAARLNHAGIVSLFDTCEVGGVQALVLELVTGESLRERLDREGRVEINRAIEIAGDVADALSAAHCAGVIHRDVKPGNILLSDDGRTLITDFGIAKAAELADNTAPGSLVGTAKYVSPEQVDDRPIDGRSDLYSLGCVLYEMVCGMVPFQGDTDVATALARVQRAPLRPRQVAATIPRAVDDVIMRSLARNPNDRYADIGAFRDALRHLRRADETVLDLPVRTAPRARPTEGAVRDPTPVTEVSFARNERAWAVSILVVLLVAAGVVGAGLLVGQTTPGRSIFDAARDVVGGQTPTTTVADDPIVLLPIAEVTDFDPEGDQSEHPETIGRLVDGDETTQWTTETYGDRELGGLKAGVGAIIQLDQVESLAYVTITSPDTGWTAEVYLADRAGRALAEFGEAIATGSATDGAPVQIELNERTGSTVLVWFTDLGDSTAVTLSVGEITVSARER